ncbi:MAG: hypothetical protein HY701_05790 [Gemmatimonadetes bacterium]|nr:hypothetical protein [Gemmatimonadota bacterium]
MTPSTRSPVDAHTRCAEPLRDRNKLKGWGQYFSIGTLEPSYRRVDRYSSELLRKFLVRRHKVPGRGTRRFRYRDLYEDLGLVRLQDRRRVSRSHALA